MADNTVFDSVFKTLVHKAPQLIVPFVNEAFGRNYPADLQVIPFSNEHETPSGTIIDDSVFRIKDKIYHIECQSIADSNMVVRMIEYDFAIALEQALASGKPYEMDFPSSCVLFLRHNSKTPDVLKMKVNLPNGDSFTYEAKVVKAQLFNSNDLFEKNLLLLLPFYLMRYEKALDQIAGDDVRTAQLIEECVELNAKLANVTLASNDRLLYEELVELIIRVSDHIMAKHEALRSKVRNAMGGEVLELLNDRAVRLEREAEERGYIAGEKRGLEQGRAQGLEQGKEQGLQLGLQQGLKQGIDKGVDSLAAKLREQGVDEETLAKAIAALQEE